MLDQWPAREAGLVQKLNSSLNQRLKIAVVGTGIAGMSAAWLLNQRHEITVYEKCTRIGGHSNTVDVPTKRGTTPVDTGFIVYNERNYPNLTALFEYLGVPTKESDMSFAASLDGGKFEYSGSNLNGLFGQRVNIIRPHFWRMVVDLMRFYREAPAFLDEIEASDISLGDFLRSRNYSESLINDHLLPMGAAIWSTTAPEMKAYPAASFIRFLKSHGLLTLSDRPQWRTVHGGSRAYVERLTQSYQNRIRFDGVRSIRRAPNQVIVEDHQGGEEFFDHVVIASHADEAFSMLSDPDTQEKIILGNWRYTKNRAVLHRDPSLMPKLRRVWSSWNFIDSGQDDEQRQLCVTYWMNQLQGIDHCDPLFVTLNPVREPAPATVLREFEYTHPFFDRTALISQRRLWKLQGARRTWFCGSYFGHGFHEDALQAGLAVAEQLGGVKRPWNVEGESDRLYLIPNPHAVAA